MFLTRHKAVTNDVQQTCVDNAFNVQDTTYPCATGDAVCYCSNAQFGYSARGCANDTCSADDAATTISWAASYCSGMQQDKGAYG
jgi:hypothetical protein